MVSIFAPHFFNWTEQLKDSGHEVYWLDVFDSNTRVEKIDFVHQIIGWRCKIDYPGRYFIKNKIPKLYKLINQVNERPLPEFFEKKLQEIKPDIVQSFVLQSAAYPILEIMKRHPEIKWVFSAWGNDLYYRQKISADLINIQNTLPFFNYMFADCTRDYRIARKHGFEGKYLGTFPTGGGYDFEIYNKDLEIFDHRKLILIKGYQGNLGRCINILKAISILQPKLAGYRIVVFGANEEVVSFCDKSNLYKSDNFELLNQITHSEVLKLMGEALIYIGNSVSDGMPNTLLEAIIMGAYPIQSNPGKATEEIIISGKNGLLIENPEDVNEIRNLILVAINDNENLKKGVEYNLKHIKPRLERETLKIQVVEKYKMIEEQL